MKLTATLILSITHHGSEIKNIKYFHSRLPKLVLNSIFDFLYLTEKHLHLAPEALNEKQTVSKNCVKNHLKIFVIKSCRILHKQRKIYLCFYKNPTIQIKFLPESAAK